MKKRIIIAFGGNALLKNGQKGSIDEQRENIKQSLNSVFPLIKQGHNIIITHGNGPQVGNILLKNDAGEIMYNIPQVPLDVAVANTQSEIGYMIQSELYNILKQHKIDREIISTNTMVEVAPDDIAFKNPTKRVGKTYYDLSEVSRISLEKSWIFKEEIKNGKKGFRRVVPSPKPLDIANNQSIKLMADNGIIVIAVGGGGIPVSIQNDQIIPEEAVIDKDLASALLANQIQADQFIILTDVDYVYLDYGSKNQKALKSISYEKAIELMKQGKFGEGNMAPKIQAALNYINKGGKEVLITDLNGLKTLKGTIITK